MALSINDFGKAVVAAGLLPAEDLKALFSSGASDVRPKDAAALAKLLVAQGHLTRYQADELLAGRGPGLVLGDYLVQEFRATIGLAKKPFTPLTFRVWGDDKQLWESSPQTIDQKGTDLQLNVRNVKVLKLEVFCPGDCGSAHALWIEPRLTPR
jgi:hypothetical protein